MRHKQKMKRACFCLVVLLSVAALCIAADGDAKRAFREAQKLEQQGKVEEAFEAYQRAAELAPGDLAYKTAREFARQRAAFRYANSGIRLLDQKHYAEAAADLERAYKIDPTNDFVKQERDRARLAAGLVPPPPSEAVPQLDTVLVPEPPLELHPKSVRRSWNLRGDLRALYFAVGAQYGIEFVFDDTLPPRSAVVRLQVDNADFSQAVMALAAITGTIVAPLEERKAIVAQDTVENHARYDRQVLRELPVDGLNTPEEINEVATALRTLLELRFISPNLRRKVISVRDSAAKVQQAEYIVDSLAYGRPQVAIEVQTLEVTKTWSRDLGVNVTYQTAAFKLSPVNGLIQSGTPVPLPQIFGDATPTAGKAATQPLAAFGNGQSLFGITLPSATLQATLSKSLLRAISVSTVRAADLQPAIFMVGMRYPIVNASFSPVLFTSAIQQQQQAGTLINPFPSFTFEDLGIKLKITPHIHADDEVTMQVETQTRALTGQVTNGVPTISNRESSQVIRVANNQPTIISGVIQAQEQKSMSGAPYLASTPVLQYLFGLTSEQASATDVIIVVTPHVLREAPFAGEGAFFPTNYIPVTRASQEATRPQQ